MSEHAPGALQNCSLRMLLFSVFGRFLFLDVVVPHIIDHEAFLVVTTIVWFDSYCRMRDLQTMLRGLLICFNIRTLGL